MNEEISPRSGQDIINILQETTSKRVWTFAGGKGGTGKTAITANIGVALATMGYRVILVDADLGGANLHTILNIKRPKLTLSDFLNRNIENLTDILLDTPSENLRLISGGSDMVGLANIPFQSKLRLQKHLELLEADYILIDLGAGTSFNTLDFFIMSNEGFIISNPEPTAKINAYSFLKSVVYRMLEREFKRGTRINELIVNEGRNNKNGSLSIPELVRRIGTIDPVSAGRAEGVLGRFGPKLIMNRLRRLSQEKEGVQLAGLSGKYLGVSTDYLGMVRDDPHVIDASESMMPFVLQFPGCGASKDIYTLVGRLGVEDRLGRFETSKSAKLKKLIKSERRYWYQ
ncbi:MAG: nucleotide-binding protein [Candidatus Latescibacterota bacterium]